MKTKLVLTNVYRLLGKMCFDQIKTQKLFIEYFDEFVEHMLDKRDIPVYFLLTELYRNNKKILNQPK